MSVIPHGTITGYTTHKCRCYECKDAMRAYVADLRARRRQQVQAEGLPEHIEHGFSAYTNWGCRCETCRAANVAHQQALRGKEQE